jgi:hypothetical protein
VIESMAKGVMEETCEAMKQRMVAAGVNLLESLEVTTSL